MERDEPILVREGWPFAAAGAFVCLFTAALGLTGPAWAFFLLTLAVAAFFRNPHRSPPEDPKAIVSPADGRVLDVRRVEGSPLFAGPQWKVSIFMSPLDVHVNRAPVSGTVRCRRYRPGRFHVASRWDASSENERMEMLLEADAGYPVGVVQIAGTLARRIVCYPREGEHLGRGERFGLIRFGSRVELHLPAQIEPVVRQGDRVRAGESVMGYGP